MSWSLTLTGDRKTTLGPHPPVTTTRRMRNRLSVSTPVDMSPALSPPVSSVLRTKQGDSLLLHAESHQENM